MRKIALRFVLIFLACCLVLTGGLVVLGYLLSQPLFISWGLPLLASMHPDDFPPGMALNTAILFILVGLGFLIIVTVLEHHD